LQGYFAAIQLLERPRSNAALVDGFGKPIPPSLELAAWRIVQRLQAPRAQLQRMEPRFLRFVEANRDVQGVVPVASELLLAAGSDRAAEYVRRWLADDPSDPFALRCRLTLSLQKGDVAASLDDAMAFVQRAPVRADAIETVARLCRENVGIAPLSSRDEIAGLGAKFQALKR
jgi:hypothetical protein